MRGAQSGRKQFGLLCGVGPTDLDEEIQSIAAQQLLPRVDHRIDRERMHQFGSAATGKVWVIANGDFLRNPENWPPLQYIRPLWISLHIAASRGERSGLTAQELERPAVSRGTPDRVNGRAESKSSRWSGEYVAVDAGDAVHWDSIAWYRSFSRSEAVRR